MGMLAVAVSALGLTGCDKSTEPDNHPPVIASITASADSINLGGTVTLIAVVTDQDGDSLGYEWSAPKGTFNATDDDTVTWTAPEVQEIVTITLKVNDGVNITTGTRDIGVEVYVPSVQPYYLGAEACSGCHSDTYSDWIETNHADARDRKIADPTGHYSSYCDGCHTVGYDTSIDNGGFDENPISDLANIQCENCHGPASAHVAGLGDVTQISASVSEDVCAGCHVSSRNNMWSDWEASRHLVGASLDTSDAGWHEGGDSCSRCHTGTGFIEYIESGAAIEVDKTTFSSINCIACHDPHNGANEHLIRELDSATMAGGEVVTDGGYGIVCMNCHTGRRSQSQVIDRVTNGYSRSLAPHHGIQGGFLTVDVFYDVSNPLEIFEWSETSHLQMENSCVTCHMEGHGGLNESGNPNVSGHAYEADVEACEPCHGILSTFDDIMAKGDYDGNGIIEGLTTEVDNLVNILEGAIVASGLDSIDALGMDYAAARPDTHDVWLPVLANGYTQIQVRAAVWNYKAVEYDHSHGIHNAAFTVQLLQQSYKFLMGVDVPNARMLTSGER